MNTALEPGRRGKITFSLIRLRRFLFGWRWAGSIAAVAIAVFASFILGGIWFHHIFRRTAGGTA